MKRLFVAALALAVLVGGPTLAHHSFAMFDPTKVQTLNGTLYSVEWKNPHSWFWIKVKTDKGQEQIWGLEGASPSVFTRQNFTRKDFVIGEKVKVEYNPLRDGRTGGKFLRMTFADGRMVGSLDSAVDRFRKKGLIQ